MSAQRERLAQRRPAETRTIEFEVEPGKTLPLAVTVGFYPDGRPGELFIAAAKEGSLLNRLLADVGVAVSVALQAGVAPAELAKSMSRLPTSPWAPATLPASPIAQVCDWLAELALRQTQGGG